MPGVSALWLAEVVERSDVALGGLVPGVRDKGRRGDCLAARFEAVEAMWLGVLGIGIAGRCPMVQAGAAVESPRRVDESGDHAGGVLRRV